jgi:hypothetical protein
MTGQTRLERATVAQLRQWAGKLDSEIVRRPVGDETRENLITRLERIEAELAARLRARPATVKPAGPFGGNSQSGRTARHGTQSGYVMHMRHKIPHDVCGGACRAAHARYRRLHLMLDSETAS